MNKIHENEELNRKTNLLNLNTISYLEKNNFRGRPKGRSKESDNINFFTLDNEDLKKLIYLYIDYHEIKKKINVCAIENYYNKSNENYYLLNNDWFKNYLNINNLTSIYDYLLRNDVIKKINNYDNLPSDQKIFIIFNSIDKKLFSNMNNKKNNDESLKDYKLLQLKYKNIQTNSYKIINYMYDFLLLKEETYKLFTKNLNINYNQQQYFCFFDNNKIFIVINDNNQFTIEVGNLNDKNDFIVEYLFDFYSSKILQDNIVSIIDNGFSQYYSFSLLFNIKNDYASPIFNQENNIIGYAFKYNPNSLINYENYTINEHLKMLVILYLYYTQLKISMKKNKIEFNNYYLINKESIEKYKNKYNYKYAYIEKELKNS